MQDKRKNTWVGVESWAVETIEQGKEQARRWFAAWLITMLALVGTNAAWIYAWQSYEYISQDGEGINSINTGSQEDIEYGSESED